MKVQPYALSRPFGCSRMRRHMPWLLLGLILMAGLLTALRSGLRGEWVFLGAVAVGGLVFLGARFAQGDVTKAAEVRSCIFLAVAYAVPMNPVPLEEIVGTADTVDNRIPEPDELCSGLGWLRAVGALERADHGYRVTPTGRQLLQAARATSGMVADQRAALQELFADTHVRFTAEEIPAETVAAAVRGYLSESARIRASLPILVNVPADAEMLD